MKKLMTLMVALLVLFCGSEDKDGKCKDRGACNNCYKIYDSEGNYINGGTISENSSRIPWDGKDCNGDSVPCGKYRVEYVKNGQRAQQEIAVA